MHEQTAASTTKNDDVYSANIAFDLIKKTPANKEPSSGEKNIIYGKAV